MNSNQVHFCAQKTFEVKKQNTSDNTQICEDNHNQKSLNPHSLLNIHNMLLGGTWCANILFEINNVMYFICAIFSFFSEYLQPLCNIGWLQLFVKYVKNNLYMQNLIQIALTS